MRVSITLPNLMKRAYKIVNRSDKGVSIERTLRKKTTLSIDVIWYVRSHMNAHVGKPQLIGNP